MENENEEIPTSNVRNNKTNDNNKKDNKDKGH